MPPALTFVLIFMISSPVLGSVVSFLRTAQSPSMMPPALTFALTFIVVLL